MLLCINLIACQAKIDAKNTEQPFDRFKQAPTIDIEGTWASGCIPNQYFGYNEITVIKFSSYNVDYKNYRYSDSNCSTQTYFEQKLGEVSFDKQNADQSYNIGYLMDIGSGFRQYFYDIIKKENDQIFFGDFMASGESSRTAINLNNPYSKVVDGYVPPVSSNPVTPNPTPTPTPTPTPLPDTSTFLGEANLNFNNNSFYASNLKTDSAYKYYKYSTTDKQTLSVNSIAGTDSCDAQPKRKFEWIEVSNDGNLGKSIEIPLFNSFTAEANKNYILKLTYSGLTDCYASYSFTIELEN